MFWCKHKWEVLSETVTKSKYESSMEAAKGAATNINLPWQLCVAERKHIQTFSCIHCGKFKRYIEKL